MCTCTADLTFYTLYCGKAANEMEARSILAGNSCFSLKSLGARGLYLAQCIASLVLFPLYLLTALFLLAICQNNTATDTFRETRGHIALAITGLVASVTPFDWHGTIFKKIGNCLAIPLI